MRIIGGRHRRRRLLSVVGSTTRPTADRTREMIFNVLLHGCLEREFSRMRVLDVFAGTGAFGFEALSRGAAFVTFIEKNAQAMARLKENGALLHEQDRMRGDLCDVFLLPPASVSYDLIFLDPPYHQHLTEPALAHLQKQGWIQKGAWIIVEGAKGETLFLSESYTLKTRRACGAASVHFFQYTKS